MQLYITDETDKGPQSGQFFNYRALVVTPEQMPGRTATVAAIREKCGPSPGAQFKLHTRSRPDSVDIELARLSKQEQVSQLEALEIRMLVYVILDDIAIRKSDVGLMKLALNTVASSFHRLLDDEDGY